MNDWIALNRKRQNHYTREVQFNLKMETIEAYGGKCACCGETAHEFLTIDHIHDDGAEERRLHGGGRTGGTAQYTRLRQQGWPKDRYQLLCMNCNFAKRNGYCPHKTGSKTFEQWKGPRSKTVRQARV